MLINPKQSSHTTERQQKDNRNTVQARRMHKATAVNDSVEITRYDSKYDYDKLQ